MKKWLSLLFLGLLSATTAFAQAVDMAADFYAKEYAVTTAEAKKRLEIISHSALISDIVIQKFGEDAIAGIFFQHTPDFMIVVRTTKQGQKHRDILTFAQNQLPDLPITVIPNSPRNFRSIENIISNQFLVLDKKISELQSIGYDPSTDELVISIYDPTAQSADELAQRYNLYKIAGMKVRVLLVQDFIFPI